MFDRLKFNQYEMIAFIGFWKMTPLKLGFTGLFGGGGMSLGVDDISGFVVIVTEVEGLAVVRFGLGRCVVVVL